MIPGLTQQEAAARLKLYGPNAVLKEEHQSAFRAFISEFKSPLVLLLIGASLISFASGDAVSATLIISIIIISSIINFVVSRKSEKAVELLAQKVSLSATVVRDGKEQDILAGDIVPGDSIVLEAGKVVPADGMVSEGNDLFINESSLTGESVPVEKNIGASVFMGSGVVTGRAIFTVTATGAKTKFYSIAALLDANPPLGEFERGIRDFSFLITKVTIVMIIIVFAVNAIFKHEILESLIFALAIAVGVTPELLPMIIATNIAKSSLVMSEKGVIVKKLSAVENFGSMDILCTDKTGTLTEDHITLVKYIDIGGADSLDVLEHAYVASSLHTGTKTPLDGAIAEYRQFDLAEYTKINEIPFDFERRRDSMLVEHNGKSTLIVKGAPEQIFLASTLSDIEKQKATALFDALSEDGYRVIGIATKDMPAGTKSCTVADEKDLCCAGFIAFIDPPKPDVKPVLDELESRGITIKIVTGDHPLVALKIAKEVGLPNPTVLNSADIDALSDEELGARAEITNIFARVTPAQKNRIIKILQAKGHTVGYMGDGINDAPALHTADVGISVSNAVDVAKEAADIILVSKSFRQLIDGVVEGRRTFANTIKYITMAVSSNFGNMFSMTGASIVLPFLPMLPVQILLNNLIYESSQFAVTFDNVEEDILRRPNPWNIKFIKKFMIVFGLASSVFDFVTFYILYRVFMLSGAAFQTGWFIESFATQVLVIFVIRSHKPIWKALRPHGAVVLSAIVAVTLAWVIALTPLGAVLGFTALTLPIIVYMAIIVAVYLVATEWVKNIFYRHVSLTL